jgi:hypothetical protein
MGETAMTKQTEIEESGFVVKRTVTLSSGGGADCTQRAFDALASLEGMLIVKAIRGPGRLRLRYDAARLGFGQIVAALEEIGCPLSKTWWSGIKTSWYSFLDDNARVNSGSRPSSCCSNPRDIYAARRRR